MENNNAHIAVLIPHFNNLNGLQVSLASIEEDCEVDIVVVDDGSDRRPKPENLNYNQGNIKVIALKKNRGIEYALNEGLKYIESKNYKYIGRLDCGDLCQPNRFKIQISFLQKNPKIALVGSWVNIIDEQGKFHYILKHPESHAELSKKIYFNSMFVHPSVIFKTSILKDIGYYPTTYKAAEDYAFFFKVVKQFKTANIAKPLVDYVIDPNSISSQKRKVQVKSRIKIILNHFYFGYYPIYGLFRNILLLFVSRNFTTVLKKMIYHKK
ncbi:MAG: glycosyltransferase [Psychroflexus sp.]|nr:glycosyltransferase [Psychroflexus sp.]